MRKLPIYLTGEEVEKFVAAIDVPRDKMIFQMMFYLGLRVSECLNAEGVDFTISEKMYRVKAEYAKRKNERRIPIPDAFLPFVKSYLSMTSKEGKLFDIKKNQVWKLSKKYAALAGLEKNVHPHTLRHSYATKIYQTTGDIRLTQELLGHKRLETTAIYTHLDDASKRRGIEGVF